MCLKQPINSYWSLLTTCYVTSDWEFKQAVQGAVHPSVLFLGPAQSVNKREEMDGSFKF